MSSPDTPRKPSESDSGPVLPLYLNLRETEVLAASVGVMIQLDGSVLMDTEAQRLAEEEIGRREGPGGVARADRALAAARERLPVLRSLYTALMEHGEALARSRPQ
jgi:hypothetical protein